MVKEIIIDGKPLEEILGDMNFDPNVARIVHALKSAYAKAEIHNSVLQNDNRLLRAKVDRLQEQSIRDPLTGLYNRGHFDKKLEEEIMRSYRTDDSYVGLMLFDIDFFKSVNDTAGHQAGDKVLKDVSTEVMSLITNGLIEVSGLLEGRTRRLDTICRYGGEEIGIVMPATLKDSSLFMLEQIFWDKAEQIRKYIEWNVRIPYNASNLDERMEKLPGYKTGREITVSIGLAVYEPDRMLIKEAVNTEAESAKLIGMADQALYHAKNSGRNRVMSYSDIQRNKTDPEDDQVIS